MQDPIKMLGNLSGRNRFIATSLLVLTPLCAIILGAVVGGAAASSFNADRMGDVGKVGFSLPSRIYDLHGELITEFFGDERRELVDYGHIPVNTIRALMSREDRDFFNHRGFSVRGTLRAAMKILTLPFGGYVSGGSTLTQQLSGHIYANRDDKSIGRKLRELWWAWQLERHLTKQQILETYLNEMPFGHSTYGVQAASKYLFGHGVSEADVAESVMMVIQLANPSGRYSPMRNPARARIVQAEIMSKMVDHGFVSAAQSKKEFDAFWDDYDWTRDSYGTAFLDRVDKAPYFSEYIRSELGDLLGGKRSIYTGGYSVYTTLDLRQQVAAQEEVERGLRMANQRRDDNSDDGRINAVNERYLPIVDLLAVMFNMGHLRLEGGQQRRFALDDYYDHVNDVLDITSGIFGLRLANNASRAAYASARSRRAGDQIESALVTLEQSTGYVTAMIGGSKFDRLNQLNRAMNAKIMPGSSFKPLYYSEAIASGRLTAASNLDNYPKAWINPDGTVYRPLNYDGRYDMNGVLLRRALALSLNIPALTVLQTVGFDAAIARASRLMGITDPEEIARTFPRVWSLGLGIIGASPVQMARAYATFPNGGRAVIPVTIRYVKNRDGQTILHPESDAHVKLEGPEAQIMSPAAAYIMVDVLRDSVRYGTLWSAYTRQDGASMNQPIAGKTGTSQNWSDAWAIGFTPYFTTAVWLGFDKGGRSLGMGNEASSSAAHVFIRYMKRIHEGLARKEFARPTEGLVTAVVNAQSGDLPSSSNSSGISELFMTGTLPTRYHSGSSHAYGDISQSFLDSPGDASSPYAGALDDNAIIMPSPGGFGSSYNTGGFNPTLPDPLGESANGSSSPGRSRASSDVSRALN